MFGVRAEQMVETFSGEYRGIPCRDVFARINPDVEIRGPVMEGEGLLTHAEFWPEFLRLASSTSSTTGSVELERLVPTR